ncbi:MAG: electron transfer flavoprotein subunit alpha/FixB family protein [Kosmotogaceae bacterium]
MKSNIMVLAEMRESEIHTSTLELLGKSRELSEKIEDSNVTVVVLSPEVTNDSSIDLLHKSGADKVLLVVNKNFERFNFSYYLHALEKISKDENPGIILAAATTTGRTIMPALAAALHTGLTADCTGLDIDEETGTLLQTRPAIGGNVIATIKTPDHFPQMATVRPKTFSPFSFDYEGLEKLEIIYFSDAFAEKQMELLDFKPADNSRKNLQDAQVVVSAGKGISNINNLNLINELASMLNGAVGASRPLVDQKWMDYESQVGLSGHTVKPNIYIAAGISGAVQHVAGMQTSDYIISLNKDKNAAIFEFSDIGLVGDATQILEELIEELKNSKGEHENV